MSIPLLPRWNLHPNRPCFYDSDSATMLELASKMQAAFNEMVTDYNKFAETINKQITHFMESSNADQEAFQVGMRQEFQDFIDVVDLKLKEMEEMIVGAEGDLETIVTAAVNEAINRGEITVSEAYDPDSESLQMTVTGGV